MRPDRAALRSHEALREIIRTVGSIGHALLAHATRHAVVAALPVLEFGIRLAQRGNGCQSRGSAVPVIPMRAQKDLPTVRCCDAAVTQSCTSFMRSIRIRMMTSGISSGRAVITVATPRRGNAMVNA